MAAGPGRFFCTAGRGLEPFLAREVRARLGATEVDCVLGKVFFSTEAELGELKKLKSGERLFLLLKKQTPLTVSRNKGKMLHDIKRLITEEPDYWLDVISTWRNLHGCKGKKGDVSQENQLPLKRKSEEETNIPTKRQKTQVRETMSEECHVEAGERCVVPERKSDQDSRTESKASLEDPSKSSGEEPIVNEKLKFRVSCRCSGAIAKILTSQEIGRAIGIALMKQFAWRADLRNPDLEIFVHLNDFHSVVGIPLFRLPLANREYIKTAGLRSTIAWAMASLAEISAGAFVLDPMCGLGTILLEAAKEWPEACYWGADISDSQLEGADVNVRTAGLMDKIELLRASVKDNGCAASVDPRIIQEPSPASSGKAGVESQQGLDVLRVEKQQLVWNHAVPCLECLALGANVSPVTGNLQAKPLAHAFVSSYSASALPLPSESFDAVISDIPFGKKFKITKDIQLLPDILQEMERVLRVGGTIVLLLSQDLHQLMDGITECAGRDSPHAISDGTSETTTAKALNVDGNSSPLVNGVDESFLSSRQTRFGSLVPDGVYGVSLGKTDAFIYRYRKIFTAGNQQVSCTVFT